MSVIHLVSPDDQHPRPVGDIQRLLNNELADDQGHIVEVHDGDIIELMGTFSQADDEFLVLSRSVTLRGVAPFGATILGGRQLQWGAEPDPAYPPSRKMYRPRPITAAIENITFENFTIGAIQIRGTTDDPVTGSGNVISNCRFENYRYGVKSANLKGAWPIVGGNASVKGSLTITHCHFGVPQFRPGGMNNLIHINNCPLDELTITDNTIDDMSFMGIVVFGVMGQTRIADNHITIGPNPWTDVPHVSAGIAFGVRLADFATTVDGRLKVHRDGSVVIERNTVTITSPDSNGIVVGLYSEEDQYLPWAAASGTLREVTIRDNVVHMNNVGNERAALACVGACSHSTWSNNVVTGSAPYGIVVSQKTWEKVQEGQNLFVVASTAAPSDNTFTDNKFAGGETIDPTTAQPHIDSDRNAVPFEAFSASKAQVLVDDTVTHLTLQGNTIGLVSGSNAGPWPRPLDKPCAGIACYGSDGQFARNDFSDSDIQGWIGGPDHVGCIYFAESACRNHVEYSETDFPKRTLQPTSRQILDESQPGMKPEVDKNIIPELTGAIN